MEFDVSVIIPMKNPGKDIKNTLRYLSGNMENVSAEYLLLDINSSNQSLVFALDGLKELGLKGKVIQCGDSPYGTVMNIGIKQAKGKYITFIFPKRMYKAFIPSYINTAVKSCPDVVFGIVPEGDWGKSLNFSSLRITGSEMFKGLIYGYTSLDLGAMMFKTSFIHSRKVYFEDNSSVGYAEEYIYKALLLSENVVQCNFPMERDEALDIPKSSAVFEGLSCFGKIDSMLRVKELLEICPVGEETKEKFIKEKLPDTVLSCADYLLNHGYNIRTVKRALKIKGYDKLLVTSPKTKKNIKRAVFNFVYTPWIYKPR